MEARHPRLRRFYEYTARALAMTPPPFRVAGNLCFRRHLHWDQSLVGLPPPSIRSREAPAEVI